MGYVSPPAPPARLNVVGPCVVSGNCITSPGFPTNCGNDESCLVTNLPAVPAPRGPGHSVKCVA
eukprot:329195-Prymnesium_polylepis.1